MPDSYTELWSSHRITLLKKARQEGARLEVLFGGPHSSLPSHKRYGVKAGDYIYPIRVDKGVMYILGRMRVREILTLEEYIESNPQMFEGIAKDPEYPDLTLSRYMERHRERIYLAPTCTEEAVVGEEGTPIKLGIAVPGDVLERLEYRSQRGVRKPKVKDGKLQNWMSVWGIYRLTQASAEAVDALLTSQLNVATSALAWSSYQANRKLDTAHFPAIDNPLAT
jgi:hypothetical protein